MKDDFDSDLETFLIKAEWCLRDLFNQARAKNELYFAGAMSIEFRGCQDAGWNAAEDAIRAYDEYSSFINDNKSWQTLEMRYPTMRVRNALSFYCLMAECSGFYEVIANMMIVIEGHQWSLTPLANLSEKHKNTGARIAPNANKVFKHLVGHAKELGLDELAVIIKDVFDHDLRNSYAHGDYVIWPDSIRVRRKHGGIPYKVSYEVFSFLLNRAASFFNLLRFVTKEYQDTYINPKLIMGRLGNRGPLLQWEIFCDRIRGSFGLRTC